MSTALRAEELQRLRADFPYLRTPARNGAELAYLDWAATSQKPTSVLETVRDFYLYSNGAAGRSTYQLADNATAAWEDARDGIAAFFHAQPDEVVFTQNATGALNLLALSIGQASLGRPSARGGAGLSDADQSDPAARLRLGPGDEIVVTRAEHHANLVPWQELAARTGASLRWLELTPDGRIDVDSCSVITEHTAILALTALSNVTGALTPLEQIVPLARQAGAVVVLDTCQSAAHIPTDFQALTALGVDAIVASSHKMLGPTGIGALIARRELLEAMPPVTTGGSMIEVVTMESSTYMPPPARFEAGSQPLAQAAGWHAAVTYLQGIGMDRLAASEHALTEQVLDAVTSVPGVQIMGPRDTHDRLGVVAFRVDGVHPHDVGQVLDSHGIAVRTGHHCAQPIHAHFGVPSSTRVSCGPTTTPAEIARLAEGLGAVRSYFGR